MLSHGQEAAILLIQDTPAGMAALDAALNEPGHLLLRADSAAGALALARSTDFALILVALQDAAADLPGTVRLLHSNPRSSQTPIIVLSAAAAAATPLQCYEAGAIDVLSGPLIPAVLKAKARFFIGAARSVSERRRVEDVLHDTRARLDTTIAAAELAIWSWDLQTDRVTADAAMQRLFNVSEQDAAGGPVAAYFTALHPDDVVLNRSLIDTAIGSGTPYEAPLRVRTADGAYRSVIGRGEVSYDSAGKPLRLRGVIIDVTRQRAAEQQLRESEERYRALFESIDEGVCIIEMLYDPAGQPCDYRFLEMNAAFARHTGLHNAVGQTVRSLVPGHEAHWFEIYGRVASTGQAQRFVNEAQAMGRWFDVYATRVGVAGSRKVAVLFNDITERIGAENELKRLAADLSEANRRKSEFLATLAHELRNPLAPLRNGLQVMRRAAGDAAAIGRVQDIMDRQLNHMVELVDDLLDVARITRGHIELRRVRVELAAILGAAVETSLPLIEAHQHRLELDLPPAPLMLLADPTRLTQIVSNLLNNAAKYTPHGGRIVLAMRRAGEHVRITVSDNGIGIDAAALPKIFEMFTQVGRDADRAHGGLGIGLSLVRALAELHGGSVQAASGGPGQGSVLTVRLPLAGADAQAAPESAAAPACADASAPATGLRVLVVDDNRDAADTLAALLNLLGHVTLVAHDGHEALRMLPGFGPQVVFLDIGMPGLSGYDVARAIRAERRFDPVLLVALTGWGGDSDRERTREAGFDHHLTKPCTLDAIEAILGSVGTPPR